MSFLHKIRLKLNVIATLKEKMTDEEKAIMNCLVTAHEENRYVTQQDISKSERWLGCHPEHEAGIVQNELETTTRMVREVIRQLRLKYGAPIISNANGYKIPTTEQEALDYMKAMEAKIKAQAKSLFETYEAMKLALSINGELGI